MTENKIFLKPTTGLTVIDPQTHKPLPPEGREVSVNTYWRRRLNDGDVAKAAAPAKPKKVKTEKNAG